MTPIIEALARYGATIAPSGFIARGGRELSVKPEIRKGRLRMVSRTGAMLFTGTADQAGVDAFVSGFWFWTPTL